MRIITEKEFWVCTQGAIPAQLQGTRKGLIDLESNYYITEVDKSTVSFVDFGCKKYMLLAAIAAALLVVAAVAVGVLTVATGGAGLVVLCAIAGVAGGAIGAVVGGLLCGHKMSNGRNWDSYKQELKIQGISSITGYCEMTCDAGGVVRFAPEIKNWIDALNYATISYGSELIKCALAGAAVGTAGTMLGVGAGTSGAGLTASVKAATATSGGTLGTGINFAGRAITGSFGWGNVGSNVVSSFGLIGSSSRVAVGAEQGNYTRATGGVNKQGEEASVANEFAKGALPEYELASRLYNKGLSGLQLTDALFLLYFLKLKADPKGTFRDKRGNLRYARGNQWGKAPGTTADKSLDPRVKPNDGRPYENNRPSYKKGQRDDVFEANKSDVDGKVWDPVDRDIEIKPTDDWIMGHKPGYEYRHLRTAYMENRITKEQFLEYYQDPQYYRPETPHTSSSGTHELDYSRYPFDN